MAQLPAVSHIALTVTDLAASVPWCERLLGTKPVLDEDTGGFHHTVYCCRVAPSWPSTRWTADDRTRGGA